MHHSLSHPVIVKIKKKGHALSIVVFEVSRHSKTHLVFSSFQNFFKSASNVQNCKTNASVIIYWTKGNLKLKRKNLERPNSSTHTLKLELNGDHFSDSCSLAQTESWNSSKYTTQYLGEKLQNNWFQKFTWFQNSRMAVTELKKCFAQTKICYCKQIQAMLLRMG